MISVIIPIYRVEAYIERCVRSLMEQTLDEVEYIFVDDCSPDGSMDVLQRVLAEYPERQQVRILRHETNRGLPAARNTGLDAATGDYIFHCDSDDYLEADALQAMYEAAQKANADIVYSDWYLTYPERARYMRCPDYATPEDALRGLLHGTMKYNVWNKLVRRGLYYNENENASLRKRKPNENENYVTQIPQISQIYLTKTLRYENAIRYDCQSSGSCLRQKLSFPEGHGMGEDMTMILLFAKARSVAYLPKGTYHYVRQNENAFTAARSEVSYEDLLFNANRVIDGLQGNVSEEDLACFKLNVKYPFLISNHCQDYERWHRWFPEANAFIPKHGVSRRARLLEWCASSRCYLPLRLHYQMLKRFQ